MPVHAHLHAPVHARSSVDRAARRCVAAAPGLVARAVIATVKGVAALPLVALLAGCTGLITPSQSRLYALDAVPPGRTTPCPIGFSVRDVRVAGHLDRDELVVAREGARIRSSAEDIWSAPLKSELPRVLTRLLLARLEGSVAVPYPWRFNEQAALALDVDVDRLEPIGGELQAQLRWTVVEPTTTPVRLIGRGSFDTRVALAGGAPDGTVRAIDVALGRFTDVLAGQAAADSRGICRAAATAARRPD